MEQPSIPSSLIPGTKRQASFPSQDEPLSKKQKFEVGIVTTTIDISPQPAQTDAKIKTSKHTKATNSPMTSEPSSKKRKADGASEAGPDAKQKKKAPPVRDLFSQWTPNIDVPTKADDFWGIKPVSGDPRPDVNQPSARSSDGAVNPPLWEDRKFRFKDGSRFVSHFGRIPREAPEDAPMVDQEDLLVITLMDMRPKTRKDRTPRRKPEIYFPVVGKPKDWADKQAVKALNDRRMQAINRITDDTPWRPMEREYLAALLVDPQTKDASIWELTELFNDRFKDKDFIEPIGFGFQEMSTGRTVESVRHEYRTYKDSYDRGEVHSGIRHRQDKSTSARKSNAVQAMLKFGPSNNQLEKEWDAAHNSGSEDENAPRDENGGDAGNPVPNKLHEVIKESIEAVTYAVNGPKLSDEDEELLALAGAYGPSGNDTSSAQMASTVSSPTHSIKNPAVIMTAVASGLTVALSFGMEGSLNDASAKNITTPESEQTEENHNLPEHSAPVVPKAAREIELDENYDDDEDDHDYDSLFEDNEI